MKTSIHFHRCRLCPYRSLQKITIQNHIKLHRRVEPTKELFNCSSNNEKDPEKRSVKCLNCTKCIFSTYSKLLFLEHMKRHYSTSIIDSITKRLDGKPSSYQTYKSTVDKYLEYHADHERSPNRKELDPDFKPYQDDKRFTCTQCSYQSKQKWNLQLHVKARHTVNKKKDDVERKFKCDKCSYESTTRTNLKKHVGNKHISDEDVDWFRCKTCDFKTKIRYTLNRHVKTIHADAQDIVWFHCDYCSYKSKRKFNLKEHVEGKHQTEGK